MNSAVEAVGARVNGRIVVQRVPAPGREVGGRLRHVPVQDGRDQQRVARHELRAARPHSSSVRSKRQHVSRLSLCMALRSAHQRLGAGRRQRYQGSRSIPFLNPKICMCTCVDAALESPSAGKAKNSGARDGAAGRVRGVVHGVRVRQRAQPPVQHRARRRGDARPPARDTQVLMIPCHRSCS